ncbi:hypothetical protein KXS11_16170 [Plantibacter flavus]|uniref:hypothetical protein n=1 Tax=Plantibacter flavus TaxID=150123 RepID=UPI003F13F64B
MSGDGTDRGGAGTPDDAADGTDWLLSQLDDDETGTIETQPEEAQPEADSTPAAPAAGEWSAAEPFTPQPFVPAPVDAPAPATSVDPLATDSARVSASADAEDDRTRVLPVIADHDAAPAAPAAVVPPVVPSTSPTDAPAEAPAGAPAAPVSPAAPGEFASESELLAWWQSQVQPASTSATVRPAADPEVPLDATDPQSEPVLPESSASAETPAAPAAPLRHPNALQLPVTPPTPAPQAPVAPVLNELTVDTDSVLQHAPAGTFRPAPTSPVVVPPVDDQPWSLGAEDDAARQAPEDVETAVLPTARALATDDPAAWAEVDAETESIEGGTSASSAEPTAAPIPPVVAPAPVQPGPSVPASEIPTAPAVGSSSRSAGPDAAATTDSPDDELPSGSWSLSETWDEDVLDGETVEVHDAVAPAPVVPEPADSAPAQPASVEPVASATPIDDVLAAGAASEPRTDPLAWLAVPFGETFGATPTTGQDTTDDEATDDDTADAGAADAGESTPETDDAETAEVDTAASDATSAVSDLPPAAWASTDDDIEAEPEPSEPVTPLDTDTTTDAVEAPTTQPAEETSEPTTPLDVPPVNLPAADAGLEQATLTTSGTFRWDAPAPAPAPEPEEPAATAGHDLDADEPAEDAEALDETRPFDSLGGPGLLAAAAAAAAVSPPPFSRPVFSPEPLDAVEQPATDDDATSVPAAFGPPNPPAERSITELISLDGVQPEPTVHPFGDAPFVWDLAPNDALDPLVHAAPTTQPIPVPPVQWESTEPIAAVSAESPSELASEGEVPDAAFVAGDLETFAPALAAETLARPLVDGPGDEFGTWTDDDGTTGPSTTTDATPQQPISDPGDTVDLFPTLSLGGLDAAALGGIAATGTPDAASATSLDDPAQADAEQSDPLESEAAEPAPSAAAEETPTVVTPVFAVDPEELDDEFDEEIVAFDAVPLAAAGVEPLPSFVPDDAEAASDVPHRGAVLDPIDPIDVVPADAAATEVVEPGEPEPVSEELRLESLFDLGPDTDLVEVVQQDDAVDGTQDDALGASPTESAVVAPEVTAPTHAATSLADTFASEGGWSLDPDATEEPALPLAPVPGVLAGDGQLDATEETAPSASVDVVAADDQTRAVAPTTPAFGTAVGEHAPAVPSRGAVVPPVQTAPAALPGETVAFPELDAAAGNLVTAAAAAGVVGADVPPPVVPSTPERDLPEYVGDRAEQGIPKALLWTVVGLGAAVLLLLAFYFGTLVGAANAGAAPAESAPTSSVSVGATSLPTLVEPAV